MKPFQKLIVAQMLKFLAVMFVLGCFWRVFHQDRRQVAEGLRTMTDYELLLLWGVAFMLAAIVFVILLEVVYE